ASTSIFGTNSATGAPIARISFDANLINTPPAQREWFFGSYYFDPAFRLGGAPGLLSTTAHDVALIVFTKQGCAVPAGQNGSCGPIPAAPTSGQSGPLPTPGLVDSLATNTAVEIAGFGVQDFRRGDGPCGGPCKPQPASAFTRFFAETTLIPSTDA